MTMFGDFWGFLGRGGGSGELNPAHLPPPVPPHAWYSRANCRSSFGTTGFAGIIVTLTWVAPERIAGGYPREPSTQSSLGLHLLHYDAWDKFGNRADRESRLVEVVQVGDAAGGQAGCACLPVAEIQRVSHDARKGHCGDGTFAYSTELLPGQISDISCCEDPHPALLEPTRISNSLSVDCDGLGEVIRFRSLNR